MNPLVFNLTEESPDPKSPQSAPPPNPPDNGNKDDDAEEMERGG